MTARRQKNKPQPQLNRQLESPETPQPKVKKDYWKEKLGDYLLDVSKYVLTAVVITSLFQGMRDLVYLYVTGILIVVITLIAGLLLTNKKKEDK